MNTTLLQLLHKLPVFSMFSETELRRMLYSGEVVRIKKFAPGDVVIREGAYGRWAFVLIKGAMEVVKAGTVLCRLHKQGEIIGEIGAVRAQQRSATVVAVADSICIAINIAVIEHMSGNEKEEYLRRIDEYLTPLIRKRLKETMEIVSLMDAIKKKRSELQQLEKRLNSYGISQEKSILQHILEDRDI